MCCCIYVIIYGLLFVFSFVISLFGMMCVNSLVYENNKGGPVQLFLTKDWTYIIEHAQPHCRHCDYPYETVEGELSPLFLFSREREGSPCSCAQMQLVR